MTTSRGILASVVTVVILGVIIGAFFLVGSPQTERIRRFDDQRSQNLQMLRYSGVDEFVRRNNALPESISDLKSIIVPGETDSFIDPENGTPLEYLKTGTDTFKLCATFTLAADASTGPVNDVFWVHPAGHACFDFKILLSGPTTKSSVPL
jgi:hypothetical protein